MVASLPRPPRVEKSKGVKEADSTAWTRSPYPLFFKFMFFETKKQSEYGDRWVRWNEKP